MASFGRLLTIESSPGYRSLRVADKGKLAERQGRKATDLGIFAASIMGCAGFQDSRVADRIFLTKGVEPILRKIGSTLFYLVLTQIGSAKVGQFPNSLKLCGHFCLEFCDERFELFGVAYGIKIVAGYVPAPVGYPSAVNRFT